MTCTREQKKLMTAHGDTNDKKYMNQETILYKIYTDHGTYVGITGNTPMGVASRFAGKAGAYDGHLQSMAKRGILVQGYQILHVFPNRFLALQAEHALRPDRNMGLNKDPGGLRGHHW